MLLNFTVTIAAFTGGQKETALAHREHEESIPKVEAVELEEGQRLLVVATTSIIGDVVANVAGDSIDLTVLVGTSQDPHGYEPTPSALAAAEKAHVLFVNGFGLEEGLLDAIEAAARGVVIPVSTGIETIETTQAQKNKNQHGPVDPHVWLDPTNVMVWVENIEYVLSAMDAKNSAVYHGRAELYLESLMSLDASMRRRFASIPVNKRKLVTDHRLFGYFAEEYGFEVAGAILPGYSTSSDTSARQIADLVEMLRREEITTIFVGTTAGRGLEKLADSISRELGQNVSIVDMLTGSLSAAGEPGDSYIDYMVYNVNQIVDGLMH